MTQADATILAAAVTAVGALIVAIVNYRTTRRTQKQVETLKAGLAKEVEVLKGEIAEQQSEKDARRDYEYEARKRLYQECEPLLFQLYELSDNALHRVYSLARTARKGNLDAPGSWLDSFDYYMASTIYNLLAPVAVYKLIQRRLTFVDLTVEPHIKAQYSLVKLIARSFTDDFDFAVCQPQRPYNPNVSAWHELRNDDSAQYWRQGIPVGRLDVAVENLIIHESTGLLRLRSFGEFEGEYYDQKSSIGSSFSILTDMFHGFHPKTRPILWRILVAQAHIYAALLKTSQHGAANNLVIVQPIPKEIRRNFDWRQGPTDGTDEEVVVEPFTVAADYLKLRLGPQFVG